MPREFDELRPRMRQATDLPPSLNAPYRRGDPFGELAPTSSPGSLARALGRDLAPQFDPYGRDVAVYENRAGAAFGVPARGMLRRSEAFQGPEYTPEAMIPPTDDGGSGRPVIGPGPARGDPGYDHLGPFIQEQLKKMNKAQVAEPQRPRLPEGFSYEEPAPRPKLPEGFSYEDDPVLPKPGAMAPPGGLVPPPARPTSGFTPKPTTSEIMGRPGRQVVLSPPEAQPEVVWRHGKPYEPGRGGRELVMDSEGRIAPKLPAPPLPPPAPLEIRQPPPPMRGAPPGMMPRIVQRGGRFYAVDSEGNLTEIPAPDMGQ